MRYALSILALTVFSAQGVAQEVEEIVVTGAAIRSELPGKHLRRSADNLLLRVQIVNDSREEGQREDEGADAALPRIRGGDEPGEHEGHAEVREPAAQITVAEGRMGVVGLEETEGQRRDPHREGEENEVEDENDVEEDDEEEEEQDGEEGIMSISDFSNDQNFKFFQASCSKSMIKFSEQTEHYLDLNEN